MTPRCPSGVGGFATSVDANPKHQLARRIDLWYNCVSATPTYTTQEAMMTMSVLTDRGSNWSPTLHVDHQGFDYYLDIPDGYVVDELIEAVTQAAGMDLDICDDHYAPPVDIPGGVRVYLTHTERDPFTDEPEQFDVGVKEYVFDFSR